jgi:hypothetical protein
MRSSKPSSSSPTFFTGGAGGGSKSKGRGVFALLATVSLVSSGIYYVHWEQKDEKEKLREGVRRDKIRLEKKLLEQQKQQRGKKQEEEIKH